MSTKVATMRSVAGDYLPANAQYVSEIPPPAKGLRVGRLDTHRRIRAELGKLYRVARRAAGPNPDAQTAIRLAAILGMLSRSVDDADKELLQEQERERETRVQAAKRDRAIRENAIKREKFAAGDEAKRSAWDRQDPLRLREQFP